MGTRGRATRCAPRRPPRGAAWPWLLAELLLCAGAPPNAQPRGRAFTLPPLEADMRIAISGAGLVLREEFVDRHVPPQGVPPGPTVLVLAGLARMCDSGFVVANAVHDCRAGRASVLALLQHYDTETLPGTHKNLPRFKMNETYTYTFEQCTANLMRAVEGSRCSLVLGRQWFGEEGTPACEAAPRNWGRAVIQTLAVGRAYAWAKHFYPRATAFVRGRLDALFCVPPMPAGGPAPGTLVSRNGFVDNVTAGVLTDDIYAAMSADVAEVYFTAWRVWVPYNCSNTCLAGGGADRADHIWPINTLVCTGEIPLAKWLTLHGIVPQRQVPQTDLLRRMPSLWRGQTDDRRLAPYRRRACGPAWPQGLRVVAPQPWTCFPQWLAHKGDWCARYARIRARKPVRCTSPVAPMLHLCLLEHVRVSAATREGRQLSLRAFPESYQPGKDGGTAAILRLRHLYDRHHQGEQAPAAVAAGGRAAGRVAQLIADGGSGGPEPGADAPAAAAEPARSERPRVGLSLSLPPLPAELTRALGEANLGVHEQLLVVRAHGLHNGSGTSGGADAAATPPWTIVLSGSPHSCDDAARALERAGRACEPRRALLVAAFLADEADKSRRSATEADACAGALVQAAKAIKCPLVLGQLAMRTRDGGSLTFGTPVGRCPGAPLAPLSNKFLPRTLAATVASGRAYAWARRLLPRTQGYVRTAVGAPLCLPAQPPSSARQLVTARASADSVTGGVLIGAGYAAMGAEAAEVYFDAWRVWSPWNCSNTCFAGAGSNLADGVMPASTKVCGIDLPVSKWLHARALAVDRVDARLRFNRDKPDLSCEACWPACVSAVAPKPWACATPQNTVLCEKYVALRDGTGAAAAADAQMPQCTGAHATAGPHLCILQNVELTTGARYACPCQRAGGRKAGGAAPKPAYRPPDLKPPQLSTRGGHLPIGLGKTRGLPRGFGAPAA